jgi:methylphosphotriester-DNA--protein-cysteine methyltransferase
VGDRQARELAERLAAHPDDRGRARELERAVRRLAATARPVDAVALEVAARLNQPQQLAHKVRAIMGTTPTRLLRSADVSSVQDKAIRGGG